MTTVGSYASPVEQRKVGGMAGSKSSSGGCCVNGVCSSASKSPPAPVKAPTNPVGISNVSSANNGDCCVNGVCSSPSKSPPGPARAPMKPAASNGGCCANGVCSSANMSSPTPARAPTKPASVAGSGGCCANGVCSTPSKSPPVRTPSTPAGSGCCSGGVCSAGSKSSGHTVVDDSAELKKALLSLNADEVKDAGNAYYKKGKFAEALQLYDRAIFLSPDKAPYRANRAAALAGLGRLQEAITECQQAVNIDLSYTRAHQRLVGLYMRIGRFDEARMKIKFAPEGELKDEAIKIDRVEGLVVKAEEACKVADWEAVLRESDAVIALGVDSDPKVWCWKAEALVNLHKLDEADAALQAGLLCLQGSEDAGRFGPEQGSLRFLRAKVDLALGRFESSIATAEAALKLDPDNAELVSIVKKARALGRARNKGNELFKAGDFKGAAAAYGDGLEADSTNAVLLCNRAACFSKLTKWDDSLKDCNAALKSHPHYPKALLRRAYCYTKMSKWSEAVREYELLQKELPNDPEIVRLLTEARAGLHKSTTNDDPSAPRSSVAEGGQVVEVMSIEQFQEAVNSSGAVVVDFSASWCGPCRQIAPLVTKLCKQFKGAKFLQVDIDKNRELATREGIQSVPTFKIYKNGKKVKEILGANASELESSVQQHCKALRVEF